MHNFSTTQLAMRAKLSRLYLVCASDCLKASTYLRQVCTSAMCRAASSLFFLT